ncbi:MAG: hypothetical protein IPL99_12295 [Candidatus Competibacteraceae bacterium]|nr:hypothetical protein [Candidatus Competibacteraceae bacterium]
MNSERLRVIYTHDGDTLTCWRTINGTAVEARIRLAFIDAPEMTQEPYGLRARAYLRSLLYVNRHYQKLKFMI